MNRPGNRFFIGPLTTAQQKRRDQSRKFWRDISEIMDARDLSFAEAVQVWKHKDEYVYHGYATGEYP